MKRIYWLMAAFASFFMFQAPALAGLDLDNQEEINIPALDLDNDGRILREEAAKYLFYYFDHDGNEVLTKGEYHKQRPLTILPYEAESVPFIDLDNDKQDDGVIYDTESFKQIVMIENYEPGEEGLKPYDMMDHNFLRMDKDKSKAVELDEWQKHYQKFAVKKPNQAPKAADNDYYAR